MADKLLGEGGFGCVFQPEIPCVRDTVYLSKKKKGVTTVSKIFTSPHTVQTENAYAKVIYSLDKEGRYFVVPTKLCKTTRVQIQKNKAVEDCKSLKNVQTKYIPQIVMPHAGIDLFGYMETYVNQQLKKVSLLVWIKLLENIFPAVKLLHQHGYVHLDIKAENIIYDGRIGRVSDFGLMSPHKKVYQSKSHNESLAYLPYPLEMLIVNYRHFHSCDEPLGGCSLYVKYMESLHSFGKMAADAFLRYHPKQEIINEVARLEQWIEEDPAWFEMVREQADKIDVYSIGNMCIHMEWFLDFSQAPPQVQMKYQQFVAQLTTLDFRNRPNIEQAYQLYKQIM